MTINASYITYKQMVRCLPFIYISLSSVPESALNVSVSEVGNPQIGQPFTLRCLASKRDGLSNGATADWSHDLSHDLSLDTGPMNFTSSYLTFHDLRFSELQTSHAGMYECIGGLQSRALDEPLIKRVQHNLTLTSELQVYRVKFFHNKKFENILNKG